MIHFLHIGKTGGTALTNSMLDIGIPEGLAIHGHEVTLRDVPVGHQAVFFLRHPVARFVSAFYSRFRQGRPMTFRPWKPDEAEAFTRFPTPRTLAEALSGPVVEERMAAEKAMCSIAHVRSSFYDWVESEAYLTERLPDVVFIGLLESFEADFDFLKELGVIPAEASLPRDNVLAHRMPSGFDSDLSPTAVANLEAWYAADIALYQRCIVLRQERWNV